MKETKQKGAWLLSSEHLSAGSPVSHTVQCEKSLLQNQKSQRNGSSIFPGKCCNLENPMAFCFFGAQGAKPPIQSDLLPKAQETYKSEIHPKVGT